MPINDEVVLAISAKDELMEKRLYRPDVIGAILLDCEFDWNKQQYYNTKVKMKKSIRKISGISNYLAGQLIEVLITNEIIREEDSYYYVNDAIAPFVKISAAGIRYVGNNLSPYCFKIYCYLLCKWNWHIKHYSGKNYYRFSESELIKYMGKARNADTEKEIKQYLLTLQEVGLIKISESQHFPGKRGRYRELQKVYSISDVQLKASKEVIEEHEQDKEEYTDSFKENFINELATAEPEQIEHVFGNSKKKAFLAGFHEWYLD